jgi:hypothetical protein
VSPFATVPSAPHLLEKKTLKDGKVRDFGEIRGIAVDERKGPGTLGGVALKQMMSCTSLAGIPSFFHATSAALAAISRGRRDIQHEQGAGRPEQSNPPNRRFWLVWRKGSAAPNPPEKEKQ